MLDGHGPRQQGSVLVVRLCLVLTSPLTQSSHARLMVGRYSAGSPC